jgi:hypothetical protein
MEELDNSRKEQKIEGKTYKKGTKRIAFIFFCKESVLFS